MQDVEAVQACLRAAAISACASSIEPPVSAESLRPIASRSSGAAHAAPLAPSAAPTPHQTLASALLREITKKGAGSRFRKADRGQFALAAG